MKSIICLCNKAVLNKKYEHELALFKKHKFGCKNEHLTAKQIHLWDEAVEEDIATVELELERLNADDANALTAKNKANKPKRRLLRITYLRFVSIMNLHQLNVLVVVSYVVSVKMSVKN